MSNARRPASPLISILVPAYNEERNLDRLYERLTSALAPLNGRFRFEILLLDNCSEDRTREVAHAIVARDPRWRYVRYSRNFGYHGSLTAGLDLAAGDAVAIQVADMQDPPEVLPKLIEVWWSGADVAYGVVRKRSDSSLIKTFGAKVVYWLIHRVSDTGIPPSATDFRVLDRRVVSVLLAMREPDRYLRGMVHWIGFTQTAVEYDRKPRTEGASTFGLWDSLLMSAHAIICFSVVPLRLMAWFGLAVVAGSVTLAAVFTGIYLFRPAGVPVPQPGITLVVVLLLFTLGLNAVFLGVIGEYIGRIYNQGKERPLYIIAETLNFPSDTQART